MADWHVIVQTIFNDDVPRASKKAALPQLAQMALVMQDSVAVSGRTLSGEKMDIFDSILGAGVESLAGRYAARHILQMIAYLRSVLGDAVMRAHAAQHTLDRTEAEIPYMAEFLDCFPRSRSQMLKKRRYDWL